MCVSNLCSIAAKSKPSSSTNTGARYPVRYPVGNVAPLCSFLVRNAVASASSNADSSVIPQKRFSLAVERLSRHLRDDFLTRREAGTSPTASIVLLLRSLYLLATCPSATDADAAAITAACTALITRSLDAACSSSPTDPATVTLARAVVHALRDAPMNELPVSQKEAGTIAQAALKAVVDGADEAKRVFALIVATATLPHTLDVGSKHRSSYCIREPLLTDAISRCEKVLERYSGSASSGDTSDSDEVAATLSCLTELLFQLPEGAGRKKEILSVTLMAIDAAAAARPEPSIELLLAGVNGANMMAAEMNDVAEVLHRVPGALNTAGVDADTNAPLRAAVAMTFILGIESMNSANGILSLLFGSAPCAMTVAALVDAIESDTVNDIINKTPSIATAIRVQLINLISDPNAHDATTARLLGLAVAKLGLATNMLDETVGSLTRMYRDTDAVLAAAEANPPVFHSASIVPVALMDIAHSVVGMSKARFRKLVLDLFVDVGNAVQAELSKSMPKPGSGRLNALLEYMGNLLPAVGASAHYEDYEEDLDENDPDVLVTAATWRAVWFYISTFGFAETVEGEYSFPHTWRDACAVIACATPALLVDTSYLESISSELQALYDAGLLFDRASLQRTLRSVDLEAMPSAADLWNLPVGLLVLALMITRLEKCRPLGWVMKDLITADPLHTCLSYMWIDFDGKTYANTKHLRTLVSCFEAAAYASQESLVHKVKSDGGNQLKSLGLHAVVLLRYISGSGSVGVAFMDIRSTFLPKLLTRLIQIAPIVTRSPKFIEECVKTLTLSENNGYPNKKSFMAGALALPIVSKLKKNHTLFTSVPQSVVVLLTSILQEATADSPHTIAALIEKSFIGMDSKTSDKAMKSPILVTLLTASSIVAKSSAIGAVEMELRSVAGDAHDASSSSSTSTSSSSAAAAVDSSSPSAAEKLARRLVEDMEPLWEQFDRIHSMPCDTREELWAAAKRTVTLSAALLVSHFDGLPSHAALSLMRVIVWVPGVLLTPSSTKDALWIWPWACTADETLQPLMLSEFGTVWQKFKKSRMGVYDSGAQFASCLCPKFSPGRAIAYDDHENASSIHSRAPVEDCGAQLSLIEWLEDVWLEEHKRDAQTLALLIRMLSSMMCPDIGRGLSTHQTACASLFRMLGLGLRTALSAAEAVASTDEVPREVLQLRDAVYRTALNWFAGEPEWFYSDEEGVSKEVDALTRFLHHLDEDDRVALPWADDSGGLLIDVQKLLHPLCEIEIQRLSVWLDPLDSARKRMHRRLGLTERQIASAFHISPRLAMATAKRFAHDTALGDVLRSTVAGAASRPEVQSVPHTVSYFVESVVDEKSLCMLRTWSRTSIAGALSLLLTRHGSNNHVASYVSRTLLSYSPDDLGFFLPQLVQKLQNDPTGNIKNFLMVAALQDEKFAHKFIWMLRGEGKPGDNYDKLPKRSGWTPPEETPMWAIADAVERELLAQLGTSSKAYFEAEDGLFDTITGISGVLKALAPAQRRARIAQELHTIEVKRSDLYLPIDENAKLVNIYRDSGRAMQSAAKTPIMVRFEVLRHGIMSPKACIFKVGDDCRQDVLALQVIEVLKTAYGAAGLPACLQPYGCIATGYEQGIIEVVPNTASRDGIGKEMDGGLLDMFRSTFGAVGSPGFERARHNFLLSCAGYAVASYILWSKDRHNGNILLSNDGSIVHIDFGYILGISPGGNLGFETAAFKFSYEMKEILDPTQDRRSDIFKEFAALVIRCYLVARSQRDAICSIVALQKESGLPCFGYGKPLERLRERLTPELDDVEAADHMYKKIVHAYNTKTTWGYDVIQQLQQGIQH